MSVTAAQLAVDHQIEHGEVRTGCMRGARDETPGPTATPTWAHRCCSARVSNWHDFRPQTIAAFSPLPGEQQKSSAPADPRRPDLFALSKQNTSARLIGTGEEATALWREPTVKLR
jgi:hypothetical protein